MTTKTISVQRVSVISKKRFEDVVTALEAAVGHPDMGAFWKDVRAAKTYPEMEKVIGRTLGPTGLMQFALYDHGQVVRKAHGEGTPKIVRFVIGNPLIMKQMVEHVPDAGSYAPVTVLVDERVDGVHLTYDTMTSFLAPYGNAAALKVAQELDAKVETVMKKAAN
jgi:uncharacterized protein (DUF302 family)